jgi:hypothetical protein
LASETAVWYEVDLASLARRQRRVLRGGARGLRTAIPIKVVGRAASVAHGAGTGACRQRGLGLRPGNRVSMRCVALETGLVSAVVMTTHAERFRACDRDRPDELVSHATARTSRWQRWLDVRELVGSWAPRNDSPASPLAAVIVQDPQVFAVRGPHRCRTRPRVIARALPSHGELS